MLKSALPALAALVLAACASTETPTPTDAPTPLPFGTVQVQDTTALPTAATTPTPRPAVCVFPVVVDEGGRIEEATVYRFEWVQGVESLTLETRGGALEITGPITLPAGERELVIVHRAELPDRIAINEDATPSTSYLLEPGAMALEARSPEGVVQWQTLLDPAEDVRGLPPNLDIVRVERQFGEGGNYIMRVSVAEPDDGEYIWTFESVEVLLGDVRYAERTLADGSVISGFYDPQGQFSEWDGTMVVQGNTVTWALDSGGELPFSARSFTSASAGDETAQYPVDLMQRLWEAARAGCG
ncbi:MAG: hypothetical protein ACE5FI_15420 [Anaerolineales bacterium]